jgi:putative heme-binding domain-containing protein
MLTLARFFTVVVACTFALSLGKPAHGEEMESLELLVATLQQVDDSAVQNAILKGMIRGLEGRRNVAPPNGWSELSKKLAASTHQAVRQQSLKLSQQFGDQQAIQDAITLIKDPAADVARRKSAPGLLLSQRNRQVSELLQSLIDDPAMRMVAIRGFAAVENTDAPELLLERYKGFSDSQRRAVVETLASRKVYAEPLLDAMTADQISPSDIPVQVARSLRGMLGDRFIKIYGDVKVMAADKNQAIARYKKICNPNAVAAANASRGRVVFAKTCAACHTLYGEGGAVGPDLTGSNRANLDYILLNSVAPSDDVPEAYRTVSVLTFDGRVVNGVLAEEDASRIVLKTPEEPRLVIAKADIEQRRVSPLSMMPDGQLDQLEKQQVLDLIKYLRTTQQVELPK